MLIVIVIVGILASALVPKLVGVQERARDVARSQDIKQIASAIMTYELDNGEYPPASWSVSNLSGTLEGNYLKSIPKDPKTQSAVLWCNANNKGEYYRTTLDDNNIDDAGFVIVSTVEQLSTANYVFSWANCPFTSTVTDLDDLTLCERVTAGTGGPCEYDENTAGQQLRLIETS